MKKTFFVILVTTWLLMVYKSIQVLVAQPDSYLVHYFAEMLTDSWQSHFNVDLFVHSILFACWVFYREGLDVLSVIYAACCIAFGAIFSFLYLLVVTFKCKGDLNLVVNGKHAQKS